MEANNKQPEEQETYFRKVSVRDRLPHSDKWVIWIMDSQVSITGKMTESEGKWWIVSEEDESWAESDFTHWLEEVPALPIKDNKEIAEREIVFPSEDEIHSAFPTYLHNGSQESFAANTVNFSKQLGAKWAIEKISSLNQVKQ